MRPPGAIHELLNAVDAGRGETDLDVVVAAAPEGPTWFSVDELLHDDDRFDATLERIARDWGTDRRDIAGAALLTDLGFALLVRSAATFLAGRRAPLLAETPVAVRLHDEGWVEEVALGPAFACLPGDPRAGDPDARPVDGDEHALLRVLLEDFEAQQASLVARVHERCRRPQAALWRHGGDTLAEAFMWAGEVLSEREHAWAWGGEAVQAGAERLRTHAGFRHFSHAGVAQVGRVRAQCCLHYRTTEASYCFSCPLKGEDHRLAVLERRAADELSG